MNKGRLVCLLILVLFPILISSPHTLAGSESAQGKITGEIKWKGDTRFPNSQILLNLYKVVEDKASKGMRTELVSRGRLSHPGEFKFVDLPSDETVYFVEVILEDANYLQGPVVLNAESSTAEVNASLYPSTTKRDALVVRRFHVIVDELEEGYRVQELVNLVNAGGLTLSTPVGEGGEREPSVTINLPKNSEGFLPLEGLVPGFFRTSRGKVEVLNAIPPGAMNVSFAYLIPYSKPKTSLSIPIDFPTEQLDVFLEKQINAEPVPALTEQEPLSNGKYRYLTGKGFAPEESVGIILRNPEIKGEEWPLPILLGALMFIAIFMGLSAIRAKRQTERPTDSTDPRILELSVEELASLKKEHVEAIVLLDEAYEKGEIDEASWVGKRLPLKDRLVEIHKALENLK